MADKAETDKFVTLLLTHDEFDTLNQLLKWFTDYCSKHWDVPSGDEQMILKSITDNLNNY